MPEGTAQSRGRRRDGSVGGAADQVHVAARRRVGVEQEVEAEVDGARLRAAAVVAGAVEPVAEVRLGAGNLRLVARVVDHVALFVRLTGVLVYGRRAGQAVVALIAERVRGLQPAPAV